MMDIKGDLVKDLREKTNAGVMDCKRALVEAKGNFEQAVQILKTKGLAAAQKKAERQASQGLVFSYIHAGGKIGVLLEINCETDFVARNAGFQELAKDIALQIAGAHPTAVYVSRQQVKPEEAGKNGNAEKYYEQVCLLDQPFIKNPSLTIQQLIQAKIAELGENIVVRRFSRFQLGEPLVEA
jgi:elongation factor Ts